MASNEQEEASTSTSFQKQPRNSQSLNQSPTSAETRTVRKNSSGSETKDKKRMLPGKKERAKEDKITKMTDSEQSSESNISKSGSDVSNSESDKNKTDEIAVTSARSIFDIDEDEPHKSFDHIEKNRVGDKLDGKCNKEGSRTDKNQVEENKLGDSQLSEEERTQENVEKRTIEQRSEFCDKDNAKEDQEEESGEEEDEEEMEEVMVHGRRRDVLQQHGLPSWTSISININVDAGEFSLSF